MSTVIERSAVISACGNYRYELWRRWSDERACVFIGLNPSTADATLDDPTIRKCIGYARRWGYGALCMVNLFAWRATDPRDMLTAADPVGPANDYHLNKATAEAHMIIAAWGAHGGHMDRDREVIAMFPRLHALHRTKSGAPGHPLYLPGNAAPFLFTV